MKNILLFVNPKSRQGSQFREGIKIWLEQEGFHVLNGPFDPKKDNLTDVIYRHEKDPGYGFIF